MQEFNVESIFKIEGSQSFNDSAREIFHFQRKNNEVYAEFLQRINKYDIEPTLIEDIPFLPITFFKNREVLCGENHEIVFNSSGTGGIQSQHLVREKAIYTRSYLEGFKRIYGDASSFTYLCLLPSYLERQGSSLVTMAQGLIDLSTDDRSGFFLYDHDALSLMLKALALENKPTILLGVSYALLDYAQNHQQGFENLIVMETGGMKGRKKEITRHELHEQLSLAFSTKHIHSEYGMTELLSQAYSTRDGIFQSPPWMKLLTRESSDPLTVSCRPGSGALNVIDLANVYSCSFIALDDLGQLFDDGTFTVTGRMDNSDIRGCNLMATQDL